ncbi:MAG: hypothetical protein GX810_00355 [Clostridiales bacterium]|nr:hypothetical protein [Clostridiales bacterium]
MALIWQGVVCTQALAVPGVSHADAVPPYRRFVFQISLKLVGLVLVLFAMTLPLQALTFDGHQAGLLTESWLPAALWYGVIALLLAYLLYRLTLVVLVNRGNLILPDKAPLPNRAWQLRAATALVTAAALWLSISSIANIGYRPITDLVQGLTFDTFEAFRDYVEKEDVDYGPQDVQLYIQLTHEYSRDAQYRHALILGLGMAAWEVIGRVYHRRKARA